MCLCQDVFFLTARLIQTQWHAPWCLYNNVPLYYCKNVYLNLHPFHIVYHEDDHQPSLHFLGALPTAHKCAKEGRGQVWVE